MIDARTLPFILPLANQRDMAWNNFSATPARTPDERFHACEISEIPLRILWDGMERNRGGKRQCLGKMLLYLDRIEGPVTKRRSPLRKGPERMVVDNSTQERVGMIRSDSNFKFVSDSEIREFKVTSKIAHS